MVLGNRWQLDSKIEKVTSLSPGRGTLTNKWRVPKPSDEINNFNKICYFRNFK